MTYLKANREGNNSMPLKSVDLEMRRKKENNNAVSPTLIDRTNALILATAWEKKRFPSVQPFAVDQGQTRDPKTKSEGEKMVAENSLATVRKV